MDAINGNHTNINGYKPELTGNDKRVGNSADEAIYGIFNHDKGSNGKIDEGVFQGKKGDCWLISGVLSLSYTKDGEKVIRDAISKNDDGSYNVYFKGIDKTYKISEKELKEANKGTFLNGMGITSSTYSTGDDDMLLMELAVEKIVKEGEIPINTDDGITGGSAYYLYQLLTNNEVSYAYGKENEKGVKNLLDYYETYQDSCSATIGVMDEFAGLEEDHAYAVKSYDGNSITLVNPWNSTKDIRISSKDLMDNIASYDISLTDGDILEDQNWLDEYYA